MVEIPENVATAADLAYWYDLQARLAALKAEEALLRGKIFKSFFPNPIEGTNLYDLADGTGAVLKATHVVNRDVDDAAVDNLKVELREHGVNVNKLIQRKPSLIIREYRSLTEEERTLFDQCLIIKPGSPQLKIEIPKRAKPAAHV